MTAPRLTTRLQVSALIRLVEADGGFAAVLQKGDPDAGALLVVGRVKGQKPALFERFPSLEGSSKWQEITIQTTDNEQEMAEYMARRRARDPDIWILELDVPFAERLADILAVTA